ncbi:MAG: hypothetical protein IKI09_11665, partial [Bacteroidales bacterium]|nr:hypothetical protein [Bacteroidales bacterium]
MTNIYNNTKTLAIAAKNPTKPQYGWVNACKSIVYSDLSKTKTNNSRPKTLLLALLLALLAPAAARAQQQTTKPLPYSYGFEDAGELDCWDVVATSSNTGIVTVSVVPEGSKVFSFHYSEQDA